MSGSPSQFRITDVEGALVTLLKAAMPAAYGTVDAPIAIDIDTIGDKDFDEGGQLVLQPPSMRVRFSELDFDNLRDNQRLSYQADQLFEILCFESNLRSKKEERIDTLTLVQVALNQLAGARLALADTTSSEPIGLVSVQPVFTEAGPVDQLQSIIVRIRGIAQYDGPNARFGS